MLISGHGQLSIVADRLTAESVVAELLRTLATAKAEAAAAEEVGEGKTKPWAIEALEPEALIRELRRTDRFVSRMRALWNRQVPACWYFHVDLGLELVAARQAWEGLLTKGSAHAVMVYLGHDLPTYVEPLCSHIGDNEREHRLPGREGHRKVDTSDIATLDKFLESPWFGWIWCGDSVPEEMQHER